MCPLTIYVLSPPTVSVYTSLICSGDLSIEVTSIDKGPEKIRDVYSLSVGGDNTYIVDGHIVHNK